MKELTKITEATYDVDEEEIEDMSAKEYNDEMSEVMETGYYFPGFPAIRAFPHIKIARTDEQKETCTKIAKQKNKMGPGVVAFHCLEHGKCFGFIILQDAESPKIMLDTIVSRLPSPPKVIVYDNGCNLQEYILNRFPNFFRDTRVFVDGFHYKSHTNCPSTYDSGFNVMLTKSLNTSLAEQKNARYAHLKRTAPLLSLSSLALKLRYVLNYHNE